MNTEKSDAQLLREIKLGNNADSLNELFSKYTLLIEKCRNSLIKSSFTYKMKIQEEIDDYYANAYETYIKAVNGIKINLVGDKYIFYIQFYGYLRSMNRDIKNHYYKKLRNETAIISSSEEGKEYSNVDICSSTNEKSAEKQIFNDLEKNAFWKTVKECNKIFTPEQKKIWSIKEKGKISTRAICELLNMDSKQYRKTFLEMKEIFYHQLTIQKEKLMLI